MGTIAVTGAASGMGLATAARLRRDGHTVLGVDLQDVDVVADLATPEGRRRAIVELGDRCGGVLDGLATFAGVGGLPGRPGSLLVSVNYFGTVELLEGIRPMLARAEAPAAVAISSNATTTVPGVPLDLIDACVAGDETEARRRGDDVGSVAAYPATKVAVARWVRRQATTHRWAGAGITLNAVAPGATETPMVAEARADPELGPLVEGFALPIGRLVRPAEIAGLVGYLLGPDARFFCGSIVFGDGGTDALVRPDYWPAPPSDRPAPESQALVGQSSMRREG